MARDVLHDGDGPREVGSPGWARTSDFLINSATAVTSRPKHFRHFCNDAHFARVPLIASVAYFVRLGTFHFADDARMAQGRWTWTKPATTRGATAGD
jgi:hypothetical protein